MIADGPRSVPPVSWEHASLQQIRDSLSPAESEQDIYRVVDQFGEWAAELESQLAEHERHWVAMSGSSAGEAHAAAAEHSAQTRADLAAAVDDVRTVQSSLDSLAATFSDVRGRVERLYQELQATRQHMLDWAVARDDEPNEMARRDITQWARSLMGQYEQIANTELRTWPSAGTHVAGDVAMTDASTATTVPLANAPAFSGDDRPTKPLRSAEGQSATGMASGAAMPGSAFDVGDMEHRHNRFSSDEQLFGPQSRAFPPVIGVDSEYEKDEDHPW